MLIVGANPGFSQEKGKPKTTAQKKKEEKKKSSKNEYEKALKRQKKIQTPAVRKRMKKSLKKAEAYNPRTRKKEPFYKRWFKTKKAGKK